MQLRSGATTGGTAPRTPPRSPTPETAGEIPHQIEITTPQRQEGDEDAAVPRTPVQMPQVYTAGTYVADFGRSPSVPANFRPAQFSFLPQPVYKQQESQVIQEIQTAMKDSLMDLILFQTNQ